jgi:hypothetical protein
MNDDLQNKVAAQILSDGLKMTFRPHPSDARLRLMASPKDIVFIKDAPRTIVLDSIESFEENLKKLSLDHFILNFDFASNKDRILEVLQRIIRPVRIYYYESDSAQS